MKRFLFFSSYFDGNTAKLWRSFFKSFVIDYPDTESHFLFVDITGNTFIDEISSFTTNQIAVGEMVKTMPELTDYEVQELSLIRDEYFLSRLRLQLTWQKASILSDPNLGFEKAILMEIKFFLNYLSDHRIEFVCVDMVTPFNSLECVVLEANKIR